MIKKTFYLLSFLAAIILSISWISQEEAVSKKLPKEVVIKKGELWADSVMTQLNLDEKIGQLFMIDAFSKKGPEHIKQIEELISKHHIGGLIFFQGGPERQAILNNQYQKLAKVPLMIAMDAEWGLSMRLDSCLKFPMQMTLAAAKNGNAMKECGEQIAAQCRLMGVHVNFAPVVDINVNPNNPVIGVRSFGSEKESVADLGLDYMNALQDNGVMACAKHFPGHGDTDVDSHLDLPVINHDICRLDSTEFYPFKRLIDGGVGSIMVAHLQVPSIDSREHTPTTLSPIAINGFLRGQLGFKNLTFTDALCMKGVANYCAPGEADVKAFLAGNDVLLYSVDVPTGIVKIKEAILKGDIQIEELDRRVKKILVAKYQYGYPFDKVERGNLAQKINDQKTVESIDKAFRSAITVVKDDSKIIPFKELANLDMATVTLGNPENKIFEEYFDYYKEAEHFSFDTKVDINTHIDSLMKDENAFYSRGIVNSDLTNIFNKVKSKKVVVVAIKDISNRPQKSFNLKPDYIRFVERLSKETKVVVVLFGNPYALKYFNKAQTVLCTYEENEFTDLHAPQVLFGAEAAIGVLPIEVGVFRAGMGVQTQKLDRLTYSYKLLDKKYNQFSAIDNIALKAIKDKATPGCQIMVVQKGQVQYYEAFGKPSYGNTKDVQRNSLYDIASVSKVTGTLQAVMMLYDQGKIDINQKVSTYLPEFKGTDKENMMIKDVLMHQAGYVPFIPFWKNTLKKEGGINPTYLSVSKSERYPLQVADKLYAIAAIQDTLWDWVIQSKLSSDKVGGLYPYSYSDLSFYTLKKMVEVVSGLPLDQYLEKNIYATIGMDRLLYNPLTKYSLSEIMPTAGDTYFRNKIVHGTVHDEGAALSGGVAGHAGIFATCNDMAKLFQMNLNKGSYGGMNYFKPNTVNYFASTKSERSRRALGWDKPADHSGGGAGNLAPKSTYGHTGFTGTCTWIDPDNEIIYIFLSNRVNTDIDNQLLIKNNVRTDIHDAIYKSMK